MGRNKKPLSYKRINLLGRKRYSGDGEACLVIESCFDDCWGAIWRLWVIIIALALVVYRKIEAIKS